MVPWRQLHGNVQTTWAAATTDATPKALKSILVLITFQWNLVRLAYLEAVLNTVTNYPTTVAVVVVTNEPKALEYVAADRSWDNRVSILQELPSLAHPFMLTHVHRSVVRERSQTGEFTSVMYLEDDMVLTWPSLLAWAADHELLAPLRFQRGMVRFEFAPWAGKNGTRVAIDQVARMQLDPKRTVTVQTPSGPKHFVNLISPYSAMWIADMPLLQRFMNSTLWSQTEGVWPVRETAACGIQFLDIHPTPFMGSAVVPYNPMTKRVEDQAGVLHISNNCARDTKEQPSNSWCAVDWDDIMV